jgi:FMN phosphatase YigB (HAD superfamily)
MNSEYAQSDTVKTLIFDVDGTLVSYSSWQGIDHYGEPIVEMVELVNKLFDTGLYEIAIWSCRTNPMIQGYPQSLLMARLIKELDKIGLRYHKILYEYKPLFHCIIDDNSVNPDRIKAMRLMALLDD